MKPLRTAYLTEYFRNLTEEQKVQLLLDFFEELEIQEFVSGPTEKELAKGPLADPEYLRPYWAHTGEPLVEGLDS